MSKLDFLSELGIDDLNLGGFSTEWLGSGSELKSVTPADGSVIASIKQCDSGAFGDGCWHALIVRLCDELD